MRSPCSVKCSPMPAASSTVQPRPLPGRGSTPGRRDFTWTILKDCGGKGHNPVLWPIPTPRSLHCSRLALAAEHRERSGAQPLFMPLLICSIRVKPLTLVPGCLVASGAVSALRAVDSRVPLSGCALPGAGWGCNVAGNVPGGSCDGACVVHGGQSRGLRPVPCCRAGSVPPASKLLMDSHKACPLCPCHNAPVHQQMLAALSMYKCSYAVQCPGGWMEENGPDICYNTSTSLRGCLFL